MNLVDTSGFTESLADERLLEPEQFDELTDSMLPLCQDVTILARELVYRGWLTPFQAEQILVGASSELFLGSYVLLEPIGEGGMGRVFRARNWKINRIVALKLISEEHARHPGMIARFQREIRALGRIRHPNIVQAIDADFLPHSIFFTMEYFEGVDLGRYVLENGPMPIADACRCIFQAANALQHAHEAGLVHRDVKPSNLLLTKHDRIVKLLDLGLTRSEGLATDSAFNNLTGAGALIGTPDYMSPEQVDDCRSTDIRSDLYSLGCTFYFLLTGSAPFARFNAVVDKLYAQCEHEPTPIGNLRSGVPEDILGIVQKLMAKRRRDRFQTPADVVIALREHSRSAGSSMSDTLINSSLGTLVDAPNLQAALERTVALSRSEIAFVPAPSLQVQAQKKTRLNFTHFVSVVLIAALGLLVIWRSGLGPKSNQNASEPALNPSSTIDRIETAPVAAAEGDDSFLSVPAENFDAADEEDE